jgi:hypothetical protein
MAIKCKQNSAFNIEGKINMRKAQCRWSDVMNHIYKEAGVSGRKIKSRDRH